MKPLVFVSCQSVSLFVSANGQSFFFFSSLRFSCHWTLVQQCFPSDALPAHECTAVSLQGVCECVCVCCTYWACHSGLLCCWTFLLEHSLCPLQPCVTQIKIKCGFATRQSCMYFYFCGICSFKMGPFQLSICACCMMSTSLYAKTVVSHPHYSLLRAVFRENFAPPSINIQNQMYQTLCITLNFSS